MNVENPYKPEPRKRWTVCEAFDSYGWRDPICATDDPVEAIQAYEASHIRHANEAWFTVAIFDDNGEGEPLGADAVYERTGLCETCLGSEEVHWNPSPINDPQCVQDAPCPDCPVQR